MTGGPVVRTTGSERVVPHPARLLESSLGFRRQGLFELLERSGYRSPDDGHTGRTALIHGILGRMMVTVARAVVEVDDVGGGNSRVHKRDVVVLDRHRRVKKIT